MFQKLSHSVLLKKEYIQCADGSRSFNTFLQRKNLHIEAYNRGQNQFRHFALNDTMCFKKEKKKAFPHPTPLDNVVTMVKQPNFLWRVGSRLFSLPKYTSTGCLSDESLKKFVADRRWCKKKKSDL